MVRRTVADNSEGIAAQNLERVVKPFFTTKQSTGTGLGLRMPSELVKEHEGKIRIRSKVAKGTVVTIWLLVERRLKNAGLQVTGPSRSAMCFKGHPNVGWRFAPEVRRLAAFCL